MPLQSKSGRCPEWRIEARPLFLACCNFLFPIKGGMLIASHIRMEPPLYPCSSILNCQAWPSNLPVRRAATASNHPFSAFTLGPSLLHGLLWSNSRTQVSLPIISLHYSPFAVTHSQLLPTTKSHTSRQPSIYSFSFFKLCSGELYTNRNSGPFISFHSI
ncbi:uncharacterized protein EI90DRAFT_1129466 [Cantharellus anzutake]|uniref:uncharacterized protein n=1 Tax=Cantharellus anzutake TaxID=1750568 RepID=UPI00190768AA|nr:uncharacterized protein EI90DRAFT_1129466 [Cantharellus anzutake]KAF8310722.1 hypothetical protein EI90DRAFT_1129466 [Cantharellus anzutake]